MQRVTSGPMELDVCHKCEGSWYDMVELDRAFGMSDHDLIPTLSKGTTVDLEAPIQCPRCQAVMERARYLEDCPVLVDQCEQHGVWLDGGELKALRDHMALQIEPDRGWLSKVMGRIFGK
jgi:Zn-finger nucleic acid-binding protein